MFKQRLLDELKDWKGELGDENTEGLEGAHSNLQDLIKMLEDEIAKLRELLRLRQQYLALVTDIATFITTYTPIVQDIEASNQPTQDKIKKLDDVSCVLCLSSFGFDFLDNGFNILAFNDFLLSLIPPPFGLLFLKGDTEDSSLRCNSHISC